MRIQLAAFLGLCCFCVALGSCDAACDSSEVQTLRVSAFSLLAVGGARHLVDLLRMRIVRWPDSLMAACVVLLPALLSAALLAVGFVRYNATLISLGCSMASVYHSELLTAVTAWKKQRLDRQFTDKTVDQLLAAPYRTAVSLVLGYLTPVALGLTVFLKSGCRSAGGIVAVLALGMLLWGAAVLYVLLELHAWGCAASGDTNRFRAPVLGHVLCFTPDSFITPEWPPRLTTDASPSTVATRELDAV
jgi:hypothetical protein